MGIIVVWCFYEYYAESIFIEKTSPNEFELDFQFPVCGKSNPLILYCEIIVRTNAPNCTIAGKPVGCCQKHWGSADASALQGVRIPNRAAELNGDGARCVRPPG